MKKVILYIITKIGLVWSIGNANFSVVYAQKYDFVNYTIEQGLVQSQVNNIALEKNGFLWASTLGGVSRFDGREFKNYNYSTGLLHSLADYVYADLQQRIWISTTGGIQIKYEGILTKLISDTSNLPIYILEIQENTQGKIFVLSRNLKLYSFNEKENKLDLVKTPDGYITAIKIINDDLVLAILHKGLFKMENNKWSAMESYSGMDTTQIIRQIWHHKSNDQITILTPNSLYTQSNGKFVKTGPSTTAIMQCMYVCGEHDFFIGTSKGAIRWNNKSNHTESLGMSQGFTDNAILDIKADAESNIWFASDGEGIFRLRPNANKIYDMASGLTGNIIMAVTKGEEGEIIAGSLEHGISVIQDGQVVNKKWPANFPADLKVNSLLYDSDKNLWVGSIGKGLWKIKGTKAEPIKFNGHSLKLPVIALHQHVDSSIWVAGTRGLLKSDSDGIRLIKGINQSCFTIHSLSKDSLLIGTTKGIYCVNSNADSAIKINIPEINNFLIGGITKYKGMVAIGTLENGIYFVDIPSQNILARCNETQNLSSNIIFSLLADGDDLYAGTTHGLNKITVSDDLQTVQAYHYRTGTHLGPECNQNGILKDKDGKIWLGTTKGIFIYDTKSNITRTAPSIYLKSIEILSRPTDTISPKLNLLDQNQSSVVMLKHHQNHLLFNLHGLHLSSYEDILYQYYLSGSSESYSAPQAIANVVFPNLAPGSYTFKAKAILGSEPSKQSEEVSYSFIISPPFYKTSWFIITGVFSLLLLGALLQRYRMHLKAKQKQLVNEVRKQEQRIIQQRTSEDLHDDLGNKITRLALLTDILETKVSPDTDQQKLISQIRENIQGLYFGTKDIIWALAPNNHTLYDTVERIHHFGIELFQESGIQFTMNSTDESLKSCKPPFEFSRNLIMITKEAMHNVLKHAGAKNASICFQKNLLQNNVLLEILIKDDGKGFDMDTIKKGNGLENIQKRANRIGAKVVITKAATSGTEIKLSMKIPQSEG